MDSLGSHKNMFEFVKEVRPRPRPRRFASLQVCGVSRAASAADRMCVRAVGLVCLFLGASCPAQWAPFVLTADGRDNGHRPRALVHVRFGRLACGPVQEDDRDPPRRDKGQGGVGDVRPPRAARPPARRMGKATPTDACEV